MRFFFLSVYVQKVFEPLQSRNGHYSIHSVNVSNRAKFGGGKTEALGVKTTTDPRGTARTHWPGPAFPFLWGYPYIWGYPYKV